MVRIAQKISVLTILSIVSLVHMVSVSCKVVYGSQVRKYQGSTYFWLLVA